MGILRALENAWDSGVDLVKGGGRRVGNIAVQSLKVGGDITGLGADLITAPFDDEDWEGFTPILRKRIVGDEEYGPGAMTHLFGPQGSVGLMIGALPEPVRDGANQTLEGWEWAYRNTAARGLATIITAVQLTTSQEYSTQAGSEPELLLRGDIWDRAWEMSDPSGGDTRADTVGRAISFFLGDVDILDPEQVARHEGTAWHNNVSGTTDFLAVWFLDPTVIGSKARGAVKGAGFIGRISSKYGVWGTRATQQIAQKHRAGGAWDRAVIRPYIRARYGRTPGMVDVGGIPAAGGATKHLPMTRQELLLAGSARRVRAEADVAMARRERYFQDRGRFDRLLNKVDDILADSATQLGQTVRHTRHSGRGAQPGQVIGRYTDDVYELAAGRVRQELFYKNPHGAAISGMLVRAYGGGRGFRGAPGRDAAADVMRFFLGDNSAINRIARSSDDAANLMKGIFLNNGTVRQGVLPGVVGSHANQHGILQALMPPNPASFADDVGEIVPLWATLDRMVTPTSYSRLRASMRGTQWYTNGATGKPVRWVFDKRAHPHVLFGSPTSDLMVERMLRQAKIDPDKISKIVARWNGMDEAARRDWWHELMRDTMDAVVGQHFPNLADADRLKIVKWLIDDYYASVRHAAEDLQQFYAEPSKLGARLQRMEDGTQMASRDALSLADIGMTPERLNDIGFVPDFTRMQRVARRYKWANRDPLVRRTRREKVTMRVFGQGVSGIADTSAFLGVDWWDHLLTSFSNVWKPSVLLNPKWPMRVVGLDEQMRMASIISGPDTLWMLMTGNRRDLTEGAIRRLLTDEQILELTGSGNVKAGILELLGPRMGRLDPGRAVRSGMFGFMVAGPVGAAGAVALSTTRNRRMLNRLTRAIKNRRKAIDLLTENPKIGIRAINEAAGLENLQILGTDIRHPFGNPAQPLAEWENAASSARGMEYLLAHQGRVFKDEAIQALGEWNMVMKPPGDLADTKAVDRFRLWYERITNDQFGRSPFSQMFYDEVLTDDDIIAWLFHGSRPQGTRASQGVIDKYGKGGPATLAEVFGDEAATLTPDDVRHWVDAVRELTGRLLPDIPELAKLRAAKANGVRIELRQVIEALGGDAGIKVKYPHPLGERPKFGPPSPAAPPPSVFPGGRAPSMRGEPGYPPKEETLRWNDILGTFHAQEEIAYSGKLRGWWQKLTDRGMGRLAVLPTNTLSRHPLFRSVYYSEMKHKLFSLGAGPDGTYAVTQSALEAMEDAARVTALNAVKNVMYELADSSNFADSTRHFFPFFNAWQEVLTRWVGLTANNPQFSARMGITFRETMNLPEYEDDEGNIWVTFPIPEWATGLLTHSPDLIPGGGEFRLLGDDPFKGLRDPDTGEVTMNFRRDSANMLFQGIPGNSPLVVFAAGETVKRVPQWEEIFGFMFPYGITPSSEDGFLSIGTPIELGKSVMPAWGRSLVSATQLALRDIFEEEAPDPWEKRSPGSVMRFIGMSMLVKWQNGDEENPYINPETGIAFDTDELIEAFYRDLVHAAYSHAMLMTFAKALSPVQIKAITPWQEYVDVIRKYLNENPDTADERSLEYLINEGMGDGFWYLTSRATQSLEGLPPTLSALETRERYEDLFLKYPELGGLILGFDGGGFVRQVAEFSQFAYDHQLTTDSSLISGEKQRERFPFKDYVLDPVIREGWAKYREINDRTYATLEEARAIDNGLDLSSLRTGDAKPFRETRASQVERLAAENPIWHEDYLNRDSDWGKRIEGMRVIADDPRFVGRTDIALLGEYLYERDRMTNIMADQAAIGNSYLLDAGDFGPWREEWNQVLDRLLENPTFRDLHERWFEFDMLTPETWPQEQRNRAGIG